MVKHLTALLDNALSLSGHVSLAAGNIGYPFSDAVLSEANQSEAYVVLEISSFQAELADDLQLDGLLWTISPKIIWTAWFNALLFSSEGETL